ncbi:MAG: bifunctional diaminohydroxyphosphoribosylaminopyrimidine deaminase/5-amino-6-(5-phosphoribosylamino)uracil reductase RibD [Gammaproteobacteria bacterium]|nr:bifunctional diaminohydroxyphosphoribosylaminopyrimidine deaminase/5-amino-6-(5-phosphoribosylamino)uracil reductase RibD [Gammaproteobacteria bacterium]
MSEFSASDGAYMAQALKLATRGRYTAHPNPMVGCVLVRDGKVIGEGWHQCTGDPHAEINALRDTGDAIQATAYVTLEPCVHHGKTPPCVDALIDAEIAELVCAMSDPFDAVSGRGIAALEAAGIKVRNGLMQTEAETLNRGYLSRVQHGRPFVRVKIAASIDGAVAMRNGESQWITGPQSRADVQRLRAESGAILSGIGTVLADDPAFTVRDAEYDLGPRQPLRAILDSDLRLPLSSSMLRLAGKTLVYCSNDKNRAPLEDAGAEIIKIASAEAGQIDIGAVLDDLGRRDINDLLVEAGPALAGGLLVAKLADELVIYQAPHIMGSETQSMFTTPHWTELANRQALVITDTSPVGSDTRITARLAD